MCCTFTYDTCRHTIIVTHVHFIKLKIKKGANNIFTLDATYLCICLFVWTNTNKLSEIISYLQNTCKCRCDFLKSCDIKVLSVLHVQVQVNTEHNFIAESGI